MSDNFSKFLIKDYEYWSVYINENQCYLGRCIVWCKRENALDLQDATKEEQEELFIVLKNIEKSLEKVFKPDLLNFAFLGNITHHLHCHVIPRYSSSREFRGILFEDRLWGKNYQTDKDFKISEQVLFSIKDKIKEVI